MPPFLFGSKKKWEEEYGDPMKAPRMVEMLEQVSSPNLPPSHAFSRGWWRRWSRRGPYPNPNPNRPLGRPLPCSPCLQTRASGGTFLEAHEKLNEQMSKMKEQYAAMGAQMGGKGPNMEGIKAGMSMKPPA